MAGIRQEIHPLNPVSWRELGRGLSRSIFRTFGSTLDQPYILRSCINMVEIFDDTPAYGNVVFEFGRLGASTPYRL